MSVYREFRFFAPLDDAESVRNGGMSPADLAILIDANPDVVLVKNTSDAVFVRRLEGGQIVAIIGGTCKDGVFRHVDVSISGSLTIRPAIVAAAKRSLRHAERAGV